jgi:hypothetical protein
MRTTVPFVPYSPGSLSVAERKNDVKRRRRVVAAATAPPSVGASLILVREAATRLNERGASPFTRLELVEEVLAAEPSALPHTLRYTLTSELARPDAVLVSVDRGRFDIRQAPEVAQARPAVGDRLSSELVLEALRDLAGAPRSSPAGATVNEVWAHLADQGHYYDVSGIYRCLRRAIATGSVTVTGTRPRRFLAAAPGGTVPAARTVTVRDMTTKAETP